jgi:microcin C transport system permease protein
MVFYICKRLLLMIPTLAGVMIITFIITQFVPGGPVERMIGEIEGFGGAGEVGLDSSTLYRG